MPAEQRPTDRPVEATAERATIRFADVVRTQGVGGSLRGRLVDGVAGRLESWRAMAVVVVVFVAAAVFALRNYLE